MLTSLVLTLETQTPLTLPRHLGRSSHALLLRLIDERDAALAAELHDGSGLRSFTCSDLVGGRGDGPRQIVEAHCPVWIRFTGMSAAVSEHLATLAARPPQAVELDGQWLAVSGATVSGDQHPWAGAEGYEALCARFLHRRGAAPRRLGLHHASPTTFRSQGVNIPVPLPYLVFGSLLSRWQAFAPVAVNADIRRYAEEMVALSRYRLNTHLVRLEGRGQEVGFVGHADFALLNRDRYWGNVLALLTAFSFYAGLGAHTTMGMGQTRPAPERAG